MACSSALYSQAISCLYEHIPSLLYTERAQELVSSTARIAMPVILPHQSPYRIHTHPPRDSILFSLTPQKRYCTGLRISSSSSSLLAVPFPDDASGQLL